jgi:hypothetical protein
MIASASANPYSPELDQAVKTIFQYQAFKTEPLACRVVPETECLALDGSSACVMAIRSIMMILLIRTSV